MKTRKNMKRIPAMLLGVIMVFAMVASGMSSTATAPPFAAESLTLQPGADASSINFNWYSDRNEANVASIVEVAKANDQSDAIIGIGAVVFCGVVRLNSIPRRYPF